MSLQTTIEEIKKNQALADEDTTGGAIETLNARRGRKNQAIERLKQLKREYKQVLMASSVFILVSGEQAVEFARMTEEDFGLFQADPEEFYKDLTKRVAPVLYMNKSTISNIFEVLGRHLEDKMSELDINEYNQLLFKAGYARALTSEKDFRELVKRAVNEQIGAEIAGVQAVTSIIDKAIAKSHSDKTTPIVLAVEDPKLLSELKKDLKRLTNKVFLVNTDKTEDADKVSGTQYVSEMNKKNVEKALTTIKKSLKK